MREFVDVITSQKAAVGIFVCFEENVTSEMRKKAKEAGHIKIDNVEFSQYKIQILTVEDLFAGKKPQLPFGSDSTTFKKAQSNEEKPTKNTLF